jgi:hypothetical protein
MAAALDPPPPPKRASNSAASAAFSGFDVRLLRKSPFESPKTTGLFAANR